MPAMVLFQRFPATLAAALMVLAGCTANAQLSSPADARRRVGLPSPSGHDQPSAARRAHAGGIDLSKLPGRIAFSAGPPHGEDVYVIDADGTDLVQVTSDPAADFDPTWSPDGTRIAFRHQPGDDLTTDIHVIAVDGSGERDLTPGDGVPDWGPTWSPDGSRILWNSDHGSAHAFRGYLMNPDGSGVSPLGADVWVEYPAWSPDGTKVAFMSQTPEGTENYEIFAANADGTGLRRLTRSPGPDGWPSWSPDGKRLLFSSVRDDCLYSRTPDCKSTGDIGPFQTLYVMNADGSGERRLNEAFAQIADWSPDGRFVVFEGQSGLAVIRADGTDLTGLPTGTGSAGFPDWIE